MTFTLKLVQTDGTPADPPTIRSAVPDMRARRHDPASTRQDRWRRRNPGRRSRSAHCPGPRAGSEEALGVPAPPGPRL